MREVAALPVSARLASAADADAIAALAVALFDEIIRVTGVQHFGLDQDGTAQRCRDYLTSGEYSVALAEQAGSAVGFAAVTESRALFTEGRYGIIQELYVEPAARSQRVGAALLAAVVALAQQRRWKRLEVTTPPLPEFARTLAFYEREGFAITGGRKLKREIG